MLRDLQRFLAVDSEHRRAHRTRPVAVELPFGMNGSPLGPATLVLADGRSIAFRGKADRLDLADDGGLHVIDYKTGRSTDYRSLSELAPDQAGRKLQLAVYGAAAQAYCHHHPGIPAQAEYWFITTKGDFRTIGYAVTPTVLEAVGKTLATVASCIERGVFPARPTATATSWTDCEFCDPDGLGATQLRRQWERKRADPALAVYADLAEPERSADA
jgi:RecB family exonuclease